MSMGNAAGLKCLQVLANAEAALAIELLAGAQGIEFLAPLESRGRACGRPMTSCARSRRPSSRTALSRATSRRSPGRFGAASLSPRSSARSGRCGERGRVERRAGRGCAAISRPSAPRGATLSARSWQTEAPLRMLLNNLDPEVTGHWRAARGLRRLRRAARGHDASGDRAALLELGETTARAERKAGRRLHDPPRRPRVLIANSLLVPRWATWDEFRRLEAEGATMFGQMTAGSWIYIGRRESSRAPTRRSPPRAKSTSARPI